MKGMKLTPRNLRLAGSAFGMIGCFLLFVSWDWQTRNWKLHIPKKFTDFPRVTTLNSNDLFLIAEPDVTNKTISFDDLRRAILEETKSK
jgi:hypothetical protein